jgi:hypothetical protein
MGIILQILKWVWRSWPLIILAVCFTAHFALINWLDFKVDATHKTFALITQLVGGLIVLYSIDSNIGIIQNKKLFALFTEYIRAFPLIKRSVVIEAKSGMIATTSMDAMLAVTRNPKTIEEKLEYLQEQINDVKRDFEHETKALKNKISQNSEKLKLKFSETKTALKQIEMKMEKVSIGGIKLQLFGVLLMVYGAVTSYIA